MNATRIRLIGITGPAGVGKTTAANRFSQVAVAAGDDAVILSLADPIKEIAKRITGIPRRLIWGDNSVKNVTPTGLNFRNPHTGAIENDIMLRRMLQVIGTELGRNVFGDRVWVDVLLRRALKHAAESHRRTLWCIVPDVRFESEVRDLQNSTESSFWYVMDWTEKSSNGCIAHSSEDGLLGFFKENCAAARTQNNHFADTCVLHVRDSETTIGLLSESVARTFHWWTNASLVSDIPEPIAFRGLPMDTELPPITA